MTQLEQLAQLYGIQTSYWDMSGRQIQASAEAMLAVLVKLGADVTSLEDVPEALRDKQESVWQQVVEPVTVLRDGATPGINLRLPASACTPLRGYLKLDSGEQQDPYWSIADLPTLESAEVEGETYVVKRLPLPTGLPWGYHTLNLEMSGKTWESLLIVSPLKAYSLPADRKLWGVFTPLYALYTGKSWGGGDFSDLHELIDRVSQLGGGVVATLPFLASFFGGDTPSPYTPASRLFWNEFFIDATAIPELANCSGAKTIVNSADFQREIQTLRSKPLVDYNQQMSLKRKVLEELAKCFFTGESGRPADFRHFVEKHKSVESYARFRATGERLGLVWSQWQEPLRSGILQPSDYPESAMQYYLYSQWIAHEQLTALSRKAKQSGPGLYLDLPTGVHPHSYDTWREQGVFVPGTSVGAPPDPVFTAGQNWSFQPLHPEKIREQGYRYFIDYLRHSLSVSGMLRIDHVMAFHRLYWIPDGIKNEQGLYVRYHADEFYAILALESQRHKTVIVGEDLGLVPQEVRPAMNEYGLYRMHIAQFELTTEQQAIRKAPANSVASLNTHDMFPFAAFWSNLDISERRRLALVDRQLARSEAEHRCGLKEALLSLLEDRGLIKYYTTDVQEILNGILSVLSASPAQVVLVNLEDLWLETKPQNIPSTQGGENWRRKVRYPLEELMQLPQVTEVLNEINRIRKGLS